jgi:hypothetical protein
MAADSTLVNAFFKESISRAKADVPNLKPIYDSNIEIMRTGQRFVTGLIDMVKKENDLLRIGRDKQLSVFKGRVNQTYEKLYSMDEPLPNKVVNALRDRIKELKQDFELVNTYGKNDTEENNDARIKLLGELKRITNSVVKTRETFMTISGDAKDWNADRINPENISTLQSFLDIENMDANDNIAVQYIDGNLTFMNLATGKQFTAPQMREAIPVVDRKIQQFGTERIGGAQTRGRNDAESGLGNHYSNQDVINQVKSEYTSEVLDEEDFMNAATVEIFRGSGTFKNDLLDHASISTELIKNMYYRENGDVIPIGEIFAKWDKDTDGDVDADDYAKIPKEEIEAFKANHKRIISALTNKFDPAFDLETSKQMWGDWATNKEKQAYNRFYIKHNDLESSKIAGNYKLGSNGYLINPALTNDKGTFGRQEYIGYKMGRNGNVLYDDTAVLNSISKKEGFVDAFQNEYKPRVIDGKFLGYEIYGLKEGDTKVSYITFVSPDVAKQWAVGKTTISKDINTSNYK